MSSISDFPPSSVPPSKPIDNSIKPTNKQAKVNRRRNSLPIHLNAEDQERITKTKLLGKTSKISTELPPKKIMTKENLPRNLPKPIPLRTSEDQSNVLQRTVKLTPTSESNVPKPGASTASMQAEAVSTSEHVQELTMFGSKTHTPPPSPSKQLTPMEIDGESRMSPSGIPPAAAGVQAVSTSSQTNKPYDSILTQSIVEESRKYGGVDKLEVLWYPPTGFASVSKEEIAQNLTKENLSPQENVRFWQDFPNMKLSDYIDRIGLKYTTGSCGNTANVMEELIRPADKPVDTQHAKNATEVVAMLEKQGKSNKNNWFVRVNVGGHAFLIEYNKGKYQIHQSFWGKLTLAGNIEKNASWEPIQFHGLLKLALSTEDNLTNSEARVQLFSSAAVKPKENEIEYRFIDKPASHAVVKERTQQLSKKAVEEWKKKGDSPMKLFIVEKVAATTHEILTYSRTGKNSIEMLIEQDGLLDREEGGPPESLADFEERAKVGEGTYSFRRDGLKGRYFLAEIKNGEYIFKMKTES